MINEFPSAGCLLATVCAILKQIETRLGVFEI